MMQSQPQAARHFKVSRAYNCENRSNLEFTSVQLDCANSNLAILNSLFFQTQNHFPWVIYYRLFQLFLFGTTFSVVSPESLYKRGSTAFNSHWLNHKAIPVLKKQLQQVCYTTYER